MPDQALTRWAMRKRGLPARWVRRGKSLIRRDSALLRRYGKNFGIGVTGSVLSVLLGVGRTAILTKSMTLEDYGRMLIVINLPVFLSSFFGLRVHDLVNRFYPEFSESEDPEAVDSLILLAAVLSISLSVVLVVGMVLGAGWMADTLYDDPGLAGLIRVYAVAALVTSLGGVYAPLLRLWDRFGLIVGCQVAGNAVTLMVLWIYFRLAAGYDLTIVLLVWLGGMAIAAGPPIWVVARRRGRSLAGLSVATVRSSIERHRDGIRSTLIQTNLAGYLKVLFNPGDVFLLGVLGSSTAVAIYGLARQLTAPLLIILDNVQAAITPEVLVLHARARYAQLKRLVLYYCVPAFFGGLAVVILGILLARPLILLISKPEYLEALPTFSVLLVVIWISGVMLIFYPLGLSFDLLKWFNLSNVIAVILFAAILVWVDPLTALGMAYLQLMATFVRRGGGNIPVILALRRQVAS